MPPTVPASFQRFGALDQDAAAALLGAASSGVMTFTPIAASGAVPKTQSASFIITKTGAPAVLTLAAPIAGVDDGNHLSIISATAFAHTVTATGLFGTGAAAVNLATFAAFAGAGIDLVAYNGKWLVLGSVGVTFS